MAKPKAGISGKDARKQFEAVKRKVSKDRYEMLEAKYAKPKASKTE